MPTILCNHLISCDMKRFLNIMGIVLALSFVATSCEKAPFLTLSTPKTINFTDQGGTQSITFTANRSWSVSSSDSWCKVSPSSGESTDGNITVTLTCEQNTTYDPRSATLTVRVEELSETITVTQDTNLGLLVSPTLYDLTNAAQSIEVEVRANVKYTIDIDAACKDWITQTGTKALSTEKITFSIAANESYNNREGKITIKQTDGTLSETIEVKQSQTNGLFITSPEYDLSNEEHTLSVEVKANVSFQVSPQVDWIKYVETKTLTSSTIVLSIEANKTYDNRTGTVLVNQINGDIFGTITINQKQKDGIFVTPTDVDVDNAEHLVELEVKNNVSYDVVIPDDAKAWISIKSNTATKTMLDNKVTLAIAQNATYDNREASITIKQIDGPLAETVIIKQAQTDRLQVTNNKYEVSNCSQQLNIDVLSNVNYTVSSDVSWLSVPQDDISLSGFTLVIAENEDFKQRTGQITLSQVGGTLNAYITIEQEKAEPIEVTVAEAGSLISQLDYNTYQSIKGLKIKGEINGTDVLIIRRMSELSYLDLSDAKIRAGGSGDYYSKNDNEIGQGMFSEMRSLKTCIIPNSITSIGAAAFWKSGLEEFIIPTSVKKIESYAFSNTNLKEIYIPDSVELTFSDPYGENFMYVFDECKYLASARIPSNWERIPKGYFWGCYVLTTINIPEGITTLEEVCLCQCHALKDVVLPNSLKKIGQGVFFRDAIETITIPANVETIMEKAFGNCYQLKEFHIKAKPETLVNISTNIFEGVNKNNVTIYVPKGTLQQYILTPFGDFKNIVEE